MIQTVFPGSRSGTVTVPSSKSIAHRMLVCAGLSHEPARLRCRGISRDIMATIDCLKGLGEDITVDGEIILVNPSGYSEQSAGSLKSSQDCVELYCRESGSTLRFLLPVAGAMGKAGVFIMEGRLSERPMAEYEAVLKEHGMNIKRDKDLLYCSGQLRSGTYSLPGNISSQYFSGLMFALPLLEGDSSICIEGNLESADYLLMTEEALKDAGIVIRKTETGYYIPGNQKYHAAAEKRVEGDYSGASFFLCAGALSEKGIRVKGLNPESLQGDRRVLEILKEYGALISRSDDDIFVRKAPDDKEQGGCTEEKKEIRIDASMIPDLIPILSVVACSYWGKTTVYNGARLRMKESDRIKSTVGVLRALGADAEELPEGMVIRGGKRLSGGTVDPGNDHRIAMSAAVAAFIADGPVIVTDSECVEKSYVSFWDDLNSLSMDN